MTTFRTQQIAQVPRTECCGQACIAMILGVTLRDAVMLVGHADGTSTQELAEVLQWFDVSCGDRLSRAFKRGFPADCLVRVSTHRFSRASHWIVRLRGIWFDPGLCRPVDGRSPGPKVVLGYLPLANLRAAREHAGELVLSAGKR